MNQLLSGSRTAKTLWRGALTLGLAAAVAAVVGGAPAARAGHNDSGVFASSQTVPLLQFPEGLVAWHNKLYTATYNVVSPQDSRIFIFNASSGRLERTLGGRPGEELISAGALLGLTVNPANGDLFAAGNFTGQIIRIQHADTGNPRVSVYAQYPSGGGPEDLTFGPDGALYASDSNLGVVYRISAQGQLQLLIGPAGSGAPISDNGLFGAPVVGLSPNGLVFSADGRSLFVANTFADRVVAFDVNAHGQVVSNGRIFAQHRNPDLEIYPTGFDALVEPDTHFGPSATTALNGPDGLQLDLDGNLWASCVLGDNLTELNPHTGAVIRTLGTSANTQGGLLNAPTNTAFVGNKIFTSNLGIFSSLPWTIVQFELDRH